MSIQSASSQVNTDIIEGSWKATITATNPPGIEPFTSLITFIPDGGVIESRRLYVPNTPLGPLLESLGHGQWLRTSNREFEVNFVFLVQGAANNTSANGAALGTDNIHLKLSLNQAGDHLTGTFVSSIKDLTDNVIFTASGNYQATPIRIVLPK